MRLQQMQPGLRVRTKAQLGSTKGFLIKDHYITARKPETEGTVKGFVGGHGGDVWWVEHDDGTVAAYAYDELGQI